METFFGLAGGDLSPADAVEQGLAQVEGNLATLERCFTVFTFAQRRALASVT
jgi:hypothetical protein